MGKYRKSDQYYIDQYDRYTIDVLKEKEMLLKKAQHDLYGDENNYDEDNSESDDEFDGEIDEDTKKSLIHTFSLSLNFSESGVQAAKNKSSTIQQWKERDERKDRLIEKHPIPSAPYCSICKMI